MWACTGNRLLLQDEEAAGVAESSQHVRPPAVAGESPVSEDPYGSVAVIAINAEVRQSPRFANTGRWFDCISVQGVPWSF